MISTIPMVGEVGWQAFGYAPIGTMVCDGSEFPVGQNSALASVLGNTFGGTPGKTSAVPDLRSAAVKGASSNSAGIGTGLAATPGDHGVNALALTAVIAAYGSLGSPGQPGYIGEIVILAAPVDPSVTGLPSSPPVPMPAGFVLCDGSVLDIAENPALGFVVGDRYGGESGASVAVPPLVGALAGGTAATLAEGEGNVGTVDLTYLLATDGLFYDAGSTGRGGNQYMGAVGMFAASDPPPGMVACDGSLLPIGQNQALFSLLGTNFGGNGTTTFAVPDLQDGIPIGTKDWSEPGTVTAVRAGNDVSTVPVTYALATYGTYPTRS